MKKIILGLICFTALISSAFAEKRFFLDVGSGLGFSADIISEGGEIQYNPNFIFSGRTGFSTFFGENRVFGIYTVIGDCASFKIPDGSIADNNPFSVSNLAGFQVGPVFGVESDGVRFQIGVGLHCSELTQTIFSGFGNIGVDGEDIEIYSEVFSTPCVGFGVSPQVRFTSNKLFSFVVGADMTYDFMLKQFYADTDGNVIINSVKGSVLSVSPYCAFGINL